VVTRQDILNCMARTELGKGIPQDDALAVDQRVNELYKELWNPILYYKGWHR
jgi:hypothetical protein